MKKNIAYGTISMLLMMLVSTIGNLLLSAIIVRKMSSFDAGIWFTYLGVTTLLSFCDFGLSAALSREIALASYKHSLRIRIKNLYSTVTKILYIFLIAGVLIAILFYLLVLKKYSHHNSYILLSYIIFCVGINFRLLANPPLAVIYGLRKVALQTNLVTTSLIIGFILSIISLTLKGGILALSISYFFSYIFLYISAKLYVEYKLKYNARSKLSKIALLRIANVATNWSLMNTGAIMVLQIPGFIIVSILGPAALTPFALIRQICSSILSFSTIISNAAMPFVSEVSGRKDKDNLLKLFKYVVINSTSIALFFAILIFSTNRSIAQIWVGNAYIFNQKILLIMLIAIVLEAHHVSITKICISAGYVKFAKIALLAGALVSVLSFIFITYIGLIGAALAILISQLITNNWFAIYIAFKYIKMNINLYLEILKILFIVSLILFLMELFLNIIFHSIALHSLIFNSLIYTIFACATIFIIYPKNKR